MKQSMYIYIAVITLLIGYLSYRKKQKNNILYCFNTIKRKYSERVAKYVYAIYYLETANFTSNIFQNTNGAGVIAFAKYIPYGHKRAFFAGVNTTGVYSSKNGFDYIKFDTLLDGFTFVANYLTNSNLNINESYVNERVAKYGAQEENYLSKIKNIVKQLKIN